MSTSRTIIGAVPESNKITQNITDIDPFFPNLYDSQNPKTANVDQIINKMCEDDIQTIAVKNGYSFRTRRTRIDSDEIVLTKTITFPLSSSKKRRNRSKKNSLRKQSFVSQQTADQTFAQWFVLLDDHRNLPELSEGYMTKINRIFLNHKKNVSDNMTVYDSCFTAFKLVADFNALLDPLTLKVVEANVFYATHNQEEEDMTRQFTDLALKFTNDSTSSLPRTNDREKESEDRIEEAVAQMGAALSVNVNHSIPILDSAANVANDTYNKVLGMFTKEQFDTLGVTGAPTIFWFGLSVIIYGFASGYKIPNLFRKILYFTIPLLILTNWIRDINGLADSLMKLRTYLFSKTILETFPDVAATGETLYEFASRPKRDELPDESFASAQMDSSDLADAAGVVYGLVSFGIFGVKTPKAALQEISAFWAAKPAIEDFLTKTVSCLESVTNHMIASYTTFKPFKLLHQRSPIIEALLSKATELIEMHNRNELVPSPANQNVINSLLMKMRMEYTKLSSSKHLAAQARLFYSDMMKFEKLKVYVDKRCSAPSSSRQEPVVVMLRGPPGTAKSTTAKFIAVDCVDYAATSEQKQLLDFCKDALIFHRLPNDFWTGYHMDTISCIMDDFDQTKDVVGMTNSSFNEMIQAASAAAMPLNMAHLEEKGNTYFKAPFIICTTNTMTFKPESIRSAEALDRRMTINVLCVPRMSYCTPETKNMGPWERRLDTSKLPIFEDVDGKQGTSLAPHCQEYYRTDPSGKIIDYQSLNYEQLMNWVKKEYEKKKLWHRAMISEFSSRTTREDYDDNLIGIRKQKLSALVNVPGAFAQMGDPDEDLAMLDLEYDDSESDGSSEQALEVERFYHQIRNLENNDLMKTINRIFKVHHDMFGNLDVDLRVCIDDIVTHLGYAEYLKITDLNLPFMHYPRVDLEKPHFASEFSYRASVALSNMYATAARFCKGVSTTFMALASFIYSNAWKTTIAVLGLLFAGYGIYKMFSGESVDVGEAQSFNIGQKLGKTKPKEKWKGKDFKSVIPQASAQLGHATDDSGFQLMRSIYRKNVFVVTYESAYQSSVFGKAGLATALRGRYVMIHYHFLTRMLSNIVADEEYLKARIRFTAADAQGYVREFRVQDIVEMWADVDPQLAGKDVAIFEMPADWQPRSDIVKNFALRDDYKSFRKNIDSILMMNTDGSQSYQPALAKAQDTATSVSCAWAESWLVRDGYTYPAVTSGGDCGSLFCAMNSSIPLRKLFGIHVAGNTSQQGFAESVCQEDIEAKIKELGPPADVIEGDEMAFAVPEMGICNLPPQYNVIGMLEKRAIPSISTFSSIRRSVLYDKVSPVLCAPAALRNFVNAEGIEVSPLRKAQNKFCKQPASLETQYVIHARETYAAFLDDVSKKDVERRLFTTEECLYGIDDEKTVRGVNPATSAGYPFVLQGEVNLKKEIYKHPRGSPENLEAVKSFTLHLDTLSDKIRRGIRPNFLHVASLKDEKRPKQKVLEGSTRMFQITPFDLLVETKKYFGAFAAWCALNRIENGMTGGVNVYSSDWNSIYKKVTKYGPATLNKGAGDFACYDGSHLTKLQLACLWIIERWYMKSSDYKPEHALYRQVLFLECINAKIIFGPLISEIPHGLPSGSFLTFLLNCMMNHLYHRVSWEMLGHVYYDFDKEVFLLVHGDDSLFEVNPVFADTFNEFLLGEVMSCFGVTYTSETKGVSSKVLRSIWDVNYLKRTFRFDTTLQEVIGPMSLDATLEIINWTKKKDAIKITVDEVDVVMRELSLHDESTFIKYQKKIISAVDEVLSQASFDRPLSFSYETWKSITRKSEGFL